MAFLIETPTWEEGIYQWEEDDPVVGGEGGIDNVPTRQLANRTKWLKAQVAALADASQPLSPRLSALAALTLAANQTIYATGSASFAATAITEFARSLISAASASSARELLGAAPLLSPAMTGIPTAPTASGGTNTTQLATTAFVQAAVSALVNSSPGALDTLNELAAALGNDPNFATTITTALAGKAPLVSPEFSGTPTAPTATAGTSNTQIATTAFVQGAVSTSGTVGMLGLFRRTTAPPGWLKANGAAVSRTTYAALFAEIGTSEGPGNGSTTFNLPDWRGLFPRGWDDSRGLDLGRALGSAQESQNAAHTHSGTTSTDGSHTHTPPAGHFSINSNASYSYGGGGASLGTASSTAAAGSHNHTFSTSSSGGSEARPVNVALLACIKY
ncbi:tail fiber protein [Hydrogenophaga sp.]|uniref:tail fiber protein n=1 Tax=Hydrogenophaga sp. TaxID=1904254 RepID=UPI003F724FC4